MCELGPMTGNDKAFVWSAHDFSDEDEKDGILEKLCIRL